MGIWGVDWERDRGEAKAGANLDDVLSQTHKIHNPQVIKYINISLEQVLQEGKWS